MADQVAKLTLEEIEKDLLDLLSRVDQELEGGFRLDARELALEVYEECQLMKQEASEGAIESNSQTVDQKKTVIVPEPPAQNLVAESQENKNNVSEGVQAKDTDSIDPWTQLPIKNGLTSKSCGHVFQRETIVYQIQAHKIFGCPYNGCTQQLGESDFDFEH